MTKTRLHLIRHGEVENAGPPRYNGHIDVALSARGQDQYRAMADRLTEAPLTAVYSSDLTRCVWGAELIAAEDTDTPLLVRDARQEVVFAGYLARRGQHKALELAAPATVAPQPH